MPLSTRQPSLLTRKTRFKQPVHSNEVIEISSDSDSDVRVVNRVPRNQVKQLQQDQFEDQLKKVQEENARLQQEVKYLQQKSTLKDLALEDLAKQMKQSELAREEQEEEIKLHETQTRQKNDQYIEQLFAQNEELREENEVLRSKPDHTTLMKELCDHTTCEICICILWKPYVLPGCGHTFCQTCLEDWFKTTLDQHMEKYPDYESELQISDRLRLLLLPHCHRQIQAQARAEALALMAHQQLEPLYTCPTCREQVRTKPVEDFVLKSLVKLIAGAVGHPNPEPEVRYEGPGDPWRVFFSNTSI